MQEEGGRDMGDKVGQAGEGTGHNGKGGWGEPTQKVNRGDKGEQRKGQGRGGEEGEQSPSNVP